MFKFITTLIALFMALNSYTVTPVTDAPSKEEQHALYMEYLENALNTNDWDIEKGHYAGFFPIGWFKNDISKRYYAFYDIDGNGIDELLTGESEIGENKNVSLLNIFSIENNAVISQNFMGYVWDDWDKKAPVIYSSGTIYEPYSYEFYICYQYYRMENGELKEFCRFYTDDGFEIRSKCKMWVNKDGEKTECEINGFIAKIVIDSFNSYLGFSKVVEPDWQPMSKIIQPTVTAN